MRENEEDMENLNEMKENKEILLFKEKSHPCLQLFLVLCTLHDQRLSLLLQVGLFFRDNDPQQLVLQSLGRDHEVDQGHFGGNLREVVGVAQLCRDVETELAGILDCVLAQLDAHNAWNRISKYTGVLTCLSLRVQIV